MPNEPEEPEVEKCQQCKERPAEPEHSCPYAEEISDDYETLCNCCDECRSECSMSI